MQYNEVLKEMKLETTKNNVKNNSEKLKIKLEKAKHEYKTIPTQKIKELAYSNTEEEKQLIEEIYLDLIKQKAKEIQDITNILNKFNNQVEKEKIKNIKNAIEYFDDIIKSDKPPKQVLSQILDKVIITRNKNLEFKLKINIDELI